MNLFKKFVLVAFVLGFIALSAPQVKAGNSTDSSGSTGTISSTILGQISMWYGKVNQHRSPTSPWMTDPDGTAGAGLYSQWGNDVWGDRQVQYCQRFWPTTTSVEEYGTATITTWHGRGNIGDSTSTKPVFNCLSAQVTTTPPSGNSTGGNGTGTTTPPSGNTNACSSNTQPWVKVLNPNGGEVYQAGQEVKAKWSSCNLPAGSVVSAQLNNLPSNYGIGSLVPDTTVFADNIAYVTANDGVEIFTLPEAGNAIYGYGKNFKLQIVVHAPNSDGSFSGLTNDQSDDLFTIKNSSSTQPSLCNSSSSAHSIKVLSPDGGEVFQVGGSMIAKWSSCNISTTDNNIHLVVRNIVTNQRYYLMGFDDNSSRTINDGVETIAAIPAQIPVGKYKLEVSRLGSGVGDYDAYDESNNYFKINGSSNSNFPSGCTSNSGYSSTTGQSCDGTTSGGGSTTGGPSLCPNGNTVSSNCMTPPPSIGGSTGTTPPPTSSTGGSGISSCQITHDLHFGSSGSEVKCLQSKLGIMQSGYFGPLTEAAVKSFQSAHGINPTGFVGALTRAILNAM